MLKTAEIQRPTCKSRPKHSNGNNRHSRPRSKDFIVRSPKRWGKVPGSRVNWFPYYAGFSAGFVEDILAGLNLQPGSVILDPWLGAGTTTEIAYRKGLSVRGFDLNPAMLVVAKARTLEATKAKAAKKMLARIVNAYLALDSSGAVAGQDPLENWLKPGSVRLMRSLEQAIHDALATSTASTCGLPHTRVGELSSFAALFYLGLFRAFRQFIEPFQSSNPTWIKVPKKEGRLSLTRDVLLRRFRTETSNLIEALESESNTRPKSTATDLVIQEGTSVGINLPESSVDVIVSSPPYCTRIDYVRATLPELAVIGYPSGVPIRDLREKMIGTPTVDRTPPASAKEWGPTCNTFLSAVQGHTSKASSTYYIKYFRQYFSGAFSSVLELDRVLKSGGHCVLVVQDSYYKDIHNDLPRIFAEMARQAGWHLDRQIDFHVKRTLAGINPEVKTYRDTFQASEAVLIFSKEAKS